MGERPNIGIADITCRAAFGDALNGRRVSGEMVHRLGGRKGQHTDANTCAEHHGEPREVGELRLVLFNAELHAPGCWPKREDETENQKEGDGIDVPIVERRKNDAVQRAKHRGCLVGKGDSPEDQATHKDFGCDRDVFGEATIKAGLGNADGKVGNGWFNGHESSKVCRPTASLADRVKSV